MAKNKKNAEQPPKRGVADAAHALVKVGVSQIPAVGAPATALFEFLIRPPVERRRTEWMESIAASLDELRDEIGDFSRLAEDEGFTTTLLNASTMAMRTHQQEKLEALRNAVLNSALRNEPDDDIRAIFLELVDRFTPWHLRILKLFDNPPAGLGRAGVDYSRYYTGGASQVLEDAFSELKGQREFYDLLVGDLSAAGLFGIGSLHAVMSADGMLAQRTTPHGRRFLKFVSEPEQQA